MQITKFFCRILVYAFAFSVNPLKNKFLFPAVFFLQILCLRISFSQVWTQKASFPGTSRYAAGGFSLNGKGYIGTGNDGALKKDFWEYNPIANNWTQKADFAGTARYHVISLAINNKGYFGLGSDDFPSYNFKKDFWEYDPVGNSWLQKADFPGMPRYTASGFSLGSKGFVGTGWDQTTPYFKDFWEYDQPSNIWTQKADFGGTARQTAIGFAINGKGYIGIGWDGGNTNDFWEYNSFTNSWTQKANFAGAARYAAVGFVIANKGYIGTGGDVSVKFIDFWEYNPDLNSWIQRADFSGLGRYAASGFSIDSCGYIGTGQIGGIGQFINDFWAYCSCGYSTAGFLNEAVHCIGNSVSFDNNSTNAVSYFWDFGDSTFSTQANPTHIYNDTGTYTIMLVASNDCGNDTAFSSVNCISGNVSFLLTGDTMIEEGITIDLAVIGGYYFNWSTNETTAVIKVSPATTQTYYVTVTDSNGCMEQDSVKVEVRTCSTSVPTIFSPNNDGVNDKLFVHVKGINELNFFIYDRWGEKVFETHETTIGWEGTYNGMPLNSGVFAYYLKAKCKSGQELIDQGNITLLK